MMKRFINICCAALLVAGLVVSCEKALKVEDGIVAEWQLVEMPGYTSETLPDVYIEFKANKSFEIYQKVGEVLRYRKYTGTYVVEGSTVKGEYSDKEDWGSVYRASFEADGSVLILTSLEIDKKSGNVLSEGEACKYVKASLSKTEKDAADLMTKSVDSIRFL